MDKTKKIGLIPKLIAAIILGILIGKFMPEVVVKIFVTFSSIFGNFLGFLIPLIILGFIVSGIADLGSNAGKLLGITAGIAYVSTLIAGFFAYIVGVNVFPSFIKATTMISDAVNPEEHLLKPFFTIEMDPIMTVMSALVFAFLLGLGIAAVKGEGLRKIAFEFQQIVDKTISNVIIPLLPIYILSIFANMTYAGEVGRIISVFWKVFLIVIAMHLLIILIQFAIAGTISKKNIFQMIKNQVPGYLTAIGTQSS